MLTDFLRTATLAVKRSDDKPSARRLIRDQFTVKLCRLLSKRPSNLERSIRVKGAMNVRYRMNRGDLWSLREVLLYEVYRFHVPMPRFTLVDLGANIGLTSLWMVKNCDVGAVVAIEANAANARLTRENFVGNQIQGTVVEAAIGPMDGEAYFSDVDDSNMGRLGTAGRRVRMVSMDAVLKMIENDFEQKSDIGRLPIVVKMDIEGGELGLLEKNTEWLNQVHAVIAELHPTLVDVQICIDKIKVHGFDYFPAGSLAPDSMDFFLRKK